MCVGIVCFLSTLSANLITSSLYDAETSSDPFVDRLGGARAVSVSGGPVKWVRKRNSYVENAQAAFGPTGRAFMLAFQLLSILLVSGLFLVLVGSSIYGLRHEMPPIFTGDYALTEWSPRVWTAISLVIVLPTAFISGLKQASWMSAVGIVVLLFVFGSSTYAAANESLVDKINDLPIVRWNSLPCATAIILFSFSAHSMMPQFEESLSPQQRYLFPAISALSFGVSGLLKAFFMGVSWVAFGPHNLNDNAIQSIQPIWLRALCSLAIVLNVFMTLPMLFFVSQRVCELAFPSKGRTFWDNKNARRFILLFVVSVFALAVPDLSTIMAYCGSVISSCMMYILPSLFHARIRHKSGHLTRGLIAFHIFIITLGITAGGLGLLNTITGCKNS